MAVSAFKAGMVPPVVSLAMDIAGAEEASDAVLPGASRLGKSGSVTSCDTTSPRLDATRPHIQAEFGCIFLKNVQSSFLPGRKNLQLPLEPRCQPFSWLKDQGRPLSPFDGASQG